MQTISIDGLKHFTVDGKTYDFIPLDDWELNDCCLFEETAGVEFSELLGDGIMKPQILRAAMFVVARHHGLELTLEDAGSVKLMRFMEAVAGEVAGAVNGEGEGNGSPPAEAPKGRPPRKASSVRSKR